MRALLLTVLLVGCTDFTDVARNVCGNGLLEPGEDCDNDAANCVRCAVTCDLPSDCPSGAYACGVDGFCHAPGGQLADPTAPVTFQADDFLAAGAIFYSLLPDLPQLLRDRRITGHVRFQANGGSGVFFHVRPQPKRGAPTMAVDIVGQSARVTLELPRDLAPELWDNVLARSPSFPRVPPNPQSK